MAQTAYQTSPTPPKVEIDGQINGYWVEPEDDVPSVRPPYDPTGAILVAELPNVGDDTHHAVSLVRRNDGTFGPVSHAAVLTYFHTTGMEDGETWRFAVYEGQELASVWECIPPLQEVDQRDVARLFGDDAGGRARADYPTIVFRVRQLDGQRD